jgi:hypothetical protein
MGQKTEGVFLVLQELKTPLPTHISNPKYQNWQRSFTGINKEGNKTSGNQFFS